MIIAEIYRDKNNFILGYRVKGHANYDTYGKDIVCAAMSVLSQTTLLSLVEVCDIAEKSIKYSINEKTGFLDVKLSKDIDSIKLDKAQILFKSLIVGINSIIESYPEYVSLKNGEV